MASRTAALSLFTIGSGVLPGAKNMPQEPCVKPGSVSCISGTLGKKEDLRVASTKREDGERVYSLGR